MDHSDNKHLWLGFVWVGALFLLALRPIEDFDTFWQLQSGKYIWETKQFLYRDTFSIAADAFRLEHCWLSDLIFYAFYSMGGYALLSLLKTFVITICGALLYRWNTARGGEPSFVVPVLALCLIASAPSWFERPQLWTFLFSLLYLKILFAGREKGLRSWLWLVPIMLLWANLHLGCIFGFVLIGLFWMGELIRAVKRETTWGETARLFAAGSLTFAVSFVNPYGYRIPFQILAHLNLTKLSAGQETIMEWLPPSFVQVPLFYAIFAVWGLLVLLRLRRLDPAEGIFFLAFLYMGESQVRHTTLVSLLAAFFLPIAAQEVLLPLWKSLFPKASPTRWLRWGSLVLLAYMVLSSAYKGGLGWGVKREIFPEAATDFLLKHRLPSNIYNFYDWGGYLMWRLFPMYPVFVDGRNTSWEMLDASNRIDTASQGWREALARYGVNTVITRTCFFDSGGPVPLVDALVNDREWVLIYRDAVAVIFIREDDRFRPLRERFALPSWKAYETMRAEAARLYNEAPYRTQALLALGRSAMKIGRNQEALLFYSRYLAKVPDNREAAIMVNFLKGQGSKPEAQSW